MSKIATIILAGSLALSPLPAIANENPTANDEGIITLDSLEAPIKMKELPSPEPSDESSSDPEVTSTPTASPVPSASPSEEAEPESAPVSEDLESTPAPEDPQSLETIEPEVVPSATATSTIKSTDDEELDSIAGKVTKGDYALPLASKSYWVSSHFGPRCPVAPGAGLSHGATDLAAPRGTALYAVASGTVESVDRANGTLRVRSGNLLVSFGHIDNPTKFVSIGQKVTKGQKIAEVGNTGVSNGPHVHLAIQSNGTWVDPILWFSGKGISITNHATSVVARNNPSSCTVYTTSKTGLKQSADTNSKTLQVLPKNTKLTLTFNSSNGFWKVKTSAGKWGYVHAYRVSTKQNANVQPTISSYGKRNAKEKYSLRASRHLFDYPGTTEWSRGIIETVKAKQTVVTTGRTANGYTEVTWGSQKGWLLLDAVDRVFDRPKSTPIYRFWSPKFGDAHFYTSNKAEADKVRKTDKNWTYEGIDFKVWPLQGGKCVADTIPVYRFWSSKLASHIYTASSSEAKTLRKSGSGWSSDGTVFCALGKSSNDTQAVHRFWSPKFKKYFYTANQSEAKHIREKDRNWTYEGVAFYTPKS